MPFSSGTTVAASSAGSPPCLPAFPAPAPGLLFFHTGFSTMFYYNGARWLCADGGAAIYPFAGGVTGGKAVVLVAGVLELFDVTSRIFPSGLCAQLVGTDALVRWSGEVDGLVGLVPAAAYFAATTLGDITPYPAPDAALIQLGVAHGPTRLLVSLSQPVRL